MSLAVLKKKSKSKFSKISSSVRYRPKSEVVTENNVTYTKTSYETFHDPNYQGFSLNNPRRVDSHRNKVQTQTPMKGNVPRGNGSCCGKYNIVINKSQYNNYDSMQRTFVGNQGISVKNHHGSMAIRHKWMKRGYPHFVVKDTNPMDYDIFIRQRANQETGQNFAEPSNALVNDTCEGNNVCKKKTSDIVKRVDVMSQGEYLRSKLLKKNCLPPKNDKLPCPQPKSGMGSSCTSYNATDPCSNSGTSENGNDSSTYSTERGACG